jgi:predicted phosphodiesterase
MRIAIISDVHGNLEALRAVIPHLRRQSADAIINLGDSVTAPLWPRETLEELESLSATTIRGNHDRWLGDAGRRMSSEIIAFTAEQLSAESIDKLVSLPPTAFLFDSVLAVHGTPSSDTDYLLEDSIGDRLCPVTSATLAERLGDTSAELVLCGHSHLQNTVFAPSGRLVVNPGSVGCPRYAGNADPLVNEAGSPHARYAVATRNQGRWSVDLFVLSYDWRPVVERAREVGRGDWATAFLKGS